ncbi:MAG TPA: hypothetical protein V6D08_14340 [Candidatus Obscuribacterales bacterium]
MLNEIRVISGLRVRALRATTAIVCLVALLSVAAPAIAAPASAPAKPAPAKPAADKAAPEKPAPSKTPEPVLENVVTVTPEDLVNKPQDYLGKNVKFNANFFAFSNLALDYRPAFRSSKTHLSFLVLRPKSHIPLSELKLAMMIPKEKDPESTLLATLKDGDQLELVGKVFSSALDDPWVEVFKLKKLGGSPDEKKSVASSGEAGSSEKTGDNKPEDDKEKGSDKSKSPAPAK